MTTNETMPGATIAARLGEAAQAIADAQRALEARDERTVHEALLALARASHQGLSELEGVMPHRSRGDELRERLAHWHELLDDARLQVALAEMESREVRSEALAAAEHALRTTSDLVGTAVTQIGTALSGLRRELSRRNETTPTQRGAE